MEDFVGGVKSVNKSACIMHAIYARACCWPDWKRRAIDRLHRARGYCTCSSIQAAASRQHSIDNVHVASEFSH